MVEAEDHPHGRRLAGTIRAEESRDPSGQNVEGQVVDRKGSPESFRQPARLNHRRTTQVHMPQYWARGGSGTSVINPDMSLIRP
jgi:hypothetical protein